jgi:hypothetical protein
MDHLDGVEAYRNTRGNETGNLPSAAEEYHALKRLIQEI